MKNTDPQLSIPLAERVRPKSLDEFFGQHKLVGKDSFFRKMIESKSLASFILWGPPGSGKTTLANIIANSTDAEFFQLNAVSSGVKEVREVISIAERNREYHKRTILFIDEIHRFSKSQQDSLLAAVESGAIVLIGATTENPSFEVIPPLRSRARVYILEKLSSADLERIYQNAVKNDVVLSQLNIELIDKEFLFDISNGDAREMLNIIESCVVSATESDSIKITKELIVNILNTKKVIYDKGGEEHYNLISAFIKSVRGSDPDAAIYWLARMIDGGEDPLFIARRLIILASEDIGNASPNALLLAESGFRAVEKIGMPEGRIVLAQVTAYLASAPKSNSSYVAIDKALSEIKQMPDYSVPIHLRNAPTKLMKDIGYGADYKYPHDFNNNFVEQNYLPDEIKNLQFYFPSENGNEKVIKDRLKLLWKKKKY
ncbi:MAG: replication-associated recombination protein A [Ignavibacteriales bacterium]